MLVPLCCPSPPLDHWLPRHEAEPSAIVQHCKAVARQHHAATIDAADALTISHGPEIEKFLLELGAGFAFLAGS